MPTYSTTATSTGTTSYTYTFSTPLHTQNTWNPYAWTPISGIKPDRPRDKELPSFGDDFIDAMIGGGSDE